jgi:hypothetical protein
MNKNFLKVLYFVFIILLFVFLAHPVLYSQEDKAIQEEILDFIMLRPLRAILPSREAEEKLKEEEIKEIAEEKVDEVEEEPEVKEKPSIRERGWYARVSGGTGFDSNAISKGVGSGLPTGLSKKDTFTHNGLFAGGRRLYYSPKFVAWADVMYNYMYFYGKLSGEFDLHYIAPSARAAYRLGDKWVGGVKAGYSHAWVGYANYGNWVDVTPSLTYLLTNYANMRLAFNQRFSTYSYNVSNPTRDRDGRTSSIQIVQNFRLPNTKLSTSLGYIHAWEVTNGLDYDNNTGTVFINLWHPVFYDINARAGISYIFENYYNPNTRGETDDGYFITRQDDDLRISVSLSKSITQNTTVFTMLDSTISRSNIDTFTYDRHVVSCGITYEF